LIKCNFNKNGNLVGKNTNKRTPARGNNLMKHKVDFIYCFSYFNPVLPSVRYRAVYPLQYLEKRFGIRYIHVYPGYKKKVIINFMKGYFSALLFRKKNSIIIFQRIYTLGIYAILLKFLAFVRKRGTYYDTDDAEHLMRNPATINYFIRKCENCIVGSEELKTWAEFNNRQVYLLTSPVFDHHQFKTNREKIFTIGWIGCFGRDHKVALYKYCFPAIKSLTFAVKFIIMGVVCMDDKNEIEQYFKGNKYVQLEIPMDTDWLNEEEVYTAVSKFDVGLAPLIDNEIHRSKSAFKLKQYFSCGVPGLSNRVGENAIFLQHEINGLFCENDNDFYKALCLFNNLGEEEYNKYSKNALDSVSGFDLDHYGAELMKILDL